MRRRKPQQQSGDPCALEQHTPMLRFEKMTPYHSCLALVQDADGRASLRAGPPLARSAVPNRRSGGETNRPALVVGHVLVARGGTYLVFFFGMRQFWR